MPVGFESFHLSAGHNYFGHHGKPAGEHRSIGTSDLRCVAGRGLVGDRFFDYRPDYAGQITFFSAEVFAELQTVFDLPGASPAATRRNVVVRGLELAELIGREFCLQGVWFQGAGECKPCYWMDQALAPGAEVWLRGRGGLRARILTDGVLRLGAAELISRGESADLAGAGADRFG